MCNNYRLHVPANQIAAPFRDAGRSLDFPGGLPNLPPADYRIGDVAPYHDRQIVLLPPGAGIHWLDLSAAEDLILQPCPSGFLAVQKVWPETP